MSGLKSIKAGIPPLVTGRRGAPRLRLSLPAKLQTMYDTRRCLLLDLSKTGAQIGLENPLAEGANAILELEGIDQFGTIVRRDKSANGGLNGFAFDSPLRDADVLAVRRLAETFEESAMRALRLEAQAWVAGAK